MTTRAQLRTLATRKLRLAWTVPLKSVYQPRPASTTSRPTPACTRKLTSGLAWTSTEGKAKNWLMTAAGLYTYNTEMNEHTKQTIPIKSTCQFIAPLTPKRKTSRLRHTDYSSHSQNGTSGQSWMCDEGISHCVLQSTQALESVLQRTPCHSW